MRELKKKKAYSMLSKKEQTRKKKMRDEKRLQKTELQNYQKWLKDNHPTCQAKLNGCEGETVEAHHVLFGSYGADKDDTRVMCICRACHRWCHSNKKLSQELFLHVAESNWLQYTSNKN